jgi:hypothetical protein
MRNTAENVHPNSKDNCTPLAEDGIKSAGGTKLLHTAEDTGGTAFK